MPRVYRWRYFFTSLAGFIISAAAAPDYFDLAARMIESNVGREQGLSLGGESTAFIGLVHLPHPARPLNLD